MRAADIKRITPPAQITESDDPGAAAWLAGFETMRNAVLYLLSQEIKPSWQFTPIERSSAQRTSAV